MRVIRFFTFAFLALLVSAAQAQVTVHMVADNFFAVYTGTSSTATTQHLTGAWPTPRTAIFTPTGQYLYVAAWDDGASLEGFVGDVARASGFVTTGSPLWEVCATNQLLPPNVASAPTPAALTLKIAACNSGSRWHATSVGPNNGNASTVQVSGMNLWSNVTAIDATAAWIWDTNSTPLCTGTNKFLYGPCNPGEYLIFRINLDQVSDCLAPLPDFIINWNAGFGMLQADGTNSQRELNYFWSIQESDASWNRFGTEVTQWFPGQAGLFDLKTFYENGTGKKLKCDGYYRVKLAVANRCVSWRDTSRLVHIKCCPGEVTSPK